jgi:hypothetical protein
LKSWNRTDWLVLLLFALLVALFYWPILTPVAADRQSFPPGDFYDQFWAFTTFEANELGAGRLPLWNPYTYAGTPFWADVQAAVFYPFSLLTLLLSAPWGFSAYALTLEAIAHFWLAALFMYLFLREATNSRIAASAGAVIFTFSGYLTGYPSQQLAVLQVDIWLPLILYFILRAYKAPAPYIYLTLAGVAWGMALLAGHPQSYMIVGYLSVAYLLFLWWKKADRPIHKAIGSYLGTVIPAGAVFLGTGIALAAVQFIPAVEYTRLSVRAAGTYDKMSGGLPVTDLIQILLPGQVSYYSPLYIGIPGLLLAGWVLFMFPSRHTMFWGIAGMIALLISFGGNTFLYSPLYLAAPGFSIFRGQERWAFAFAFSMSVLAGYGMKQLMSLHIQPTAPLKTLTRLAGGVFLFAILLMLAFFYGLTNSGWSADNVFYGLLGAASLLTILSGLAWLLWRFAPWLPPQILTGLTIGLICLDLFSVNWQTNLFPQPTGWHTRQPAIVQAIHTDAGRLPEEPFRVYNEFRLYDNYGIPFGLEDLWGASPLRPARYDQFLAPPMPIERAWELLNVKYVITWRQELFVPSEVIHQEAAPDGTTYVHRLQEIGPRAWLVTRTELADDATILRKIADPTFDRWNIALLEAQSNLAVKTPPADNGAHDGLSVNSIEFHSPGQIIYQVSANRPALLIMSENFYPGWVARVDGRPTPIVRADYILRAVPVPAGEHTVTLTFRPLSFQVGVILSGLTFVTLMIYLAVSFRNRRNRFSPANGSQVHD